MSVTLNNYGKMANMNTAEFYGKSTDEKPTEQNGGNIINGSIYVEIDTGRAYFYDAEMKMWTPVTPPSADGTYTKEQIDALLNKKMSYYIVTVDGNKIVHEGEVLTYAKIQQLYEDESVFIYMEHAGLTLIPSVDVDNSIIAFSSDWMRKEGTGYEPFIYVVQITSDNTVTSQQFQIEDVANKVTAINSRNVTSEEKYPSVKAVVDYVDKDGIGSEITDIKEDLSVLSDELSILTEKPTLRNGSAGNPANPNAICTDAVIRFKYKGVTASTDIPLPSGYKYLFGLQTYNEQGAAYGTAKEIFTTDNNVYFGEFDTETFPKFRVYLFIKNDNGDYHPLRISDYQNSITVTMKNSYTGVEQRINEAENEIEELQNTSKEIKNIQDIIISPTLRNGSFGNPANLNAVCFNSSPYSKTNDITFVCNFDIPEGYQYICEFQTANASGGLYGNSVTKKSKSNRISFAISDIQKFPRFNVSVTVKDIDTDSIFHPLRISDIGNDSIKAIYNNPIDYSDDSKANLEKIENTLSELIISPTLRNGSLGNPANPNAVCFNSSPYSKTNDITFICNFDIPEGYQYIYEFQTANASGGLYGNSVTKKSKSNRIDFKIADTDKFPRFNLIITAKDVETDSLYYPLRVANIGTDVVKLIYNNTSSVDEKINAISEELAVLDSVIGRNNDSLLMVQSATNFGWNKQGTRNLGKCLGLLVTTDVHGDATRFNNAINYLNGIECIDAGICLGDIVPSNYSQDVLWYVNAVNKSTKPFYTAIGNHDGGNSTDVSISGTKQQVFDKFISPTVSKIGIPNLNKTYYSIDFTNYKVTLIVLDGYDVPDTRNGDNYAVSRGVDAMSQAQIDWLISTLNSVPSDYHVIIAMHSGFGGTYTVENSVFTQPNSTISVDNNTYGSVLSDIIDAWRNGTSLSRNYEPSVLSNYLPTLNVSVDFSSRGTGKFATFVVGHSHKDTIARDIHGNLIVQLDCTANDSWQPAGSELPRPNAGKAQDCFSVIGIDTERELVKVVRIGSNVTMRMTKRDMIALPFTQGE